MQVLPSYAHRVLTDSSEFQNECYWLGIRCVILREETKYPEVFKKAGVCWANQKPIIDVTTGKPVGQECSPAESHEGRLTAMNPHLF